MGRATRALETMAVASKEAVVEEIEAATSFRPDDVPEDVWRQIQDNGRLATELLGQILESPRFLRYRPSEQAKLIALAQNRAYGMPKAAVNTQANGKRRAGSMDVTQHALNNLVSRATLPEYKNVVVAVELDDEDDL